MPLHFRKSLVTRYPYVKSIQTITHIDEFDERHHVRISPGRLAIDMTVDHFNLRSFDLNLLLAFDALMQELSVTRAATRLRIRQPAMSHALSNLRMLFDDELFIRNGHVMEPTPRARALHEGLHPLLVQIGSALVVPTGFDPAEETRIFRLGMNGQAEALLMPVLVEHLAKHSPGITIESVPLGEHAIQNLLNDAKIDLAIAHVSEDTGRLRREMLYCEQFVCCFHPSQLAYATPIASEDYFSSVHGLVSDSANLPGFLEHLLRHAPMQLQASHLSHNGITLLAMASRAPLVASLQAGVARRYAAAFGLVVSNLPFDVDELQIDLIWHPRSENDPGISWLRRLCQSCVA